MNAGYIITDSVHVGEVEFVLGVHSTAPKQFVTWTCKDGKDYYWGHYHSDLLSATKDLLERATQEYTAFTVCLGSVLGRCNRLFHSKILVIPGKDFEGVLSVYIKTDKIFQDVQKAFFFK